MTTLSLYAEDEKEEEHTTELILHDPMDSNLQFDVKTIKAFLAHYSYLKSLGRECNGTKKLAEKFQKLLKRFPNYEIPSEIPPTSEENNFQDELNKI